VRCGVQSIDRLHPGCRHPASCSSPQHDGAASSATRCSQPRPSPRYREVPAQGVRHALSLEPASNSLPRSVPAESEAGLACLGSHRPRTSVDHADPARWVSTRPNVSPGFLDSSTRTARAAPARCGRVAASRSPRLTSSTWLHRPRAADVARRRHERLLALAFGNAESRPGFVLASSRSGWPWLKHTMRYHITHIMIVGFAERESRGPLACVPLTPPACAAVARNALADNAQLGREQRTTASVLQRSQFVRSGRAPAAPTRPPGCPSVPLLDPCQPRRRRWSP